MKFELTYPEPLRTQAVHMGNQQTLVTDAPKDNGGIGDAFSPTDLVAVGLASCIMTILGLRAASREIRILDMKADVEKKMRPGPRRVGRIEVGLIVRLNGGTDEDRNWLRDEALACPVALSLHPDLHQDIRIEFT